ncbi:MAG TPA: tripartite tricarboxylate transporter TctB family protein [Burkholderiales bacterium]
MKSIVRGPKDFWAALIYIGIGLAAVLIGRDYGMGTAFKMGPAYFPTVLGGALTLVGVISLVRSFLRKGEPVGAIAFRPLLLVVAAIVACGFLVRGAGVAVALPVLVVVSALASAKFRWGPALALAIGVTVFCVLVFLKGLGVPLPILGPWFGG